MSALPADINVMLRNACTKLRECANFIPPGARASYLVYGTSSEEHRQALLNMVQDAGASLHEAADNRKVPTTFAVFRNSIQATKNDRHQMTGPEVHVIAFPRLPEDKRLRLKLGYVQLICSTLHGKPDTYPENTLNGGDFVITFGTAYEHLIRQRNAA